MGGGKGSFHLIARKFITGEAMVGTQGRNLETGTEAEALRFAAY